MQKVGRVGSEQQKSSSSGKDSGSSAKERLKSSCRNRGKKRKGGKNFRSGKGGKLHLESLPDRPEKGREKKCILLLGAHL